MEEILRKRLAINYKDLDEKQGIMQGYFSHFDSKDSDGDIIVKGAYKKTIQEFGPAGANRTKHLKNHYKEEPVGILKELSEDATGLVYTSQLLKGDNSHGDYILHLASMNYPFEHSIGYEVVKNDTKSQPGSNILQELKLWEGSILTAWGSNPNTPVTGLKSLGSSPLETLIDARLVLEKALRVGNLHDDVYLKIQSEYNAIGTLLKAKTTEPPSTQPDAKAIAELITNSFTLKLN
ncbi:HK97 family phage prohead protease [Larkinella terrae]|uniref:HK97 family phage prohead protease n=1 Tax=Larkinella terrae TaxID=2025311 RepID=A0A7K0EJX9_9BACT|nr:HK97 family phage prohead protease [Larkinella terrae]MRS61776.1 HK97 family phage prohead protease [Larkinella terrae]